MSIWGAIIVPLPPLIISTVGRGREQEVQSTIDAYWTAAKQVAAWGPEVLIITSPHQVMYADYFHISQGMNIIVHVFRKMTAVIFVCHVKLRSWGNCKNTPGVLIYFFFFWYLW